MLIEKNLPTGYEMTREEMDKEIKRYLTERNLHQGEEWPLPVGKKWFSIKNELITTDLIRNYCNCIGDINPLFRDEEYAKTTRWGGIIAPPSVMQCVAFIAASCGVEPPSMKGRGVRPRIHGVGGLNAGCAAEWLKPIRPGDKFHCIDKFLGAEEVTKKEKPVPRLLRIRGQRKFINQRDELVCLANGIELLMIPSEPLKEGETKIKMGDRFSEAVNHYYTPEEIALIDKAMDGEIIRGAEVRYWEDTNVGDVITPIIKGPLTETDIAAGMAWRGFLPAMEVRRIIDKSDDVYSNIDPRTGDMFGEYRCHVEDALAKMFGEPSAFAAGNQFIEWAVHMVTNWMGDDAFFRKLSTRHRRMMPVNDTCWVKGKVANKYKEDDKYLLDVDIEGISWFGGPAIFTGSATVELISREPKPWMVKT